MMNHQVLPPPASETVDSAGPLLRDVTDAEILATIIEVGPDYAITGDRDLLTPEVRAAFPTKRCADFLREIADEK